MKTEETDNQGRPAGGAAEVREKGPGKLATAATMLRAATTIVVFGIPLLVGAAAVIGYGAHEAYKRLTHR